MKAKLKAKDEQENQTNPAVILAVMAGVRDLYTEHEEDIRRVLDAAADFRVTIGFTAVLDMSEAAPIIEVKMRYSQSVTDKRVTRLGDPNQTTFTFVPTAEFEKINEGDGGEDNEQ